MIKSVGGEANMRDGKLTERMLSSSVEDPLSDINDSYAIADARTAECCD